MKRFRLFGLVPKHSEEIGWEGSGPLTKWSCELKVFADFWQSGVSEIGQQIIVNSPKITSRFQQ